MFPQNLEKILWRILRLLKRLVITSYHIYVIPKSRWMITFGKWRKLSKYSHRKRPVAPHKIILLHSTSHWWKWKYSPFWMFMLTWHFHHVQVRKYSHNHKIEKLFFMKFIVLCEFFILFLWCSRWEWLASCSCTFGQVSIQREKKTEQKQNKTLSFQTQNQLNGQRSVWIWLLNFAH